MAGKKVGHAMASIGAITDIHTTQMNPLGMKMKDESGNEYIYLQGIASTAQYDWVTYDVNFLTARLAPDALGPVAIAQAAIVASSYGWYLIKGSGLGASDAMAGATKVRIFIDATGPGWVDDAIVTGDQVYNAWSTTTGGSASGAATATFQLNYPFVNNDVGL